MQPGGASYGEARVVRRLVVAWWGIQAMGCGDRTVEAYGDVTPGIRVQQPEVDTAAIPAARASALCSANVGAQVFISGGANQMLQVSEADLAAGVPATQIQLPGDPQTLPCPGSPSRYRLLTDNTVGRLPDGTIVATTLAARRDECSMFINSPPPDASRALFVRSSSDCGATWDLTTVEADQILIPGTNNPLDLTFIDRQEMYVDYEQQQVYLSFRMAETTFGKGDQETVLLRAPATPAGPLVWRSVLRYDDDLGRAAGVTGIAADPADGREELYLMECVGPNPVLSVVTNPVSFNTAGGADRQVVDVDWPAFCTLAPDGVTAANLVNRNISPRAISLGNIGSLPPAPARNLRVVYPSVVLTDNGAFQVAHIVDVSFDSSHVGSVIGERVLDGSASGLHVLWPDLQAVEEVDGLFPASQHAHVLHWTLVAEAGSAGVVAAFEQIDTWRSAFGGWQGVVNLSSHSIDGNRLDGGFFGDYKYGAPIGTEGAMPKFITTWNEQDATGLPSAQVHAAATILGGL